jgi:NAD(P)-dependent dehydrogenase (short-subunit alcohol dehydrogenase family)
LTFAGVATQSSSPGDHGDPQLYGDRDRRGRRPGRAIARRLATEGAVVVVADIDRDGGERTAREIGGRFVRADMRSPVDVRALISDAEPQILVNNAGGGGHVAPHFPEAEPDEWGATLDLNLSGPMLATQLAIEPMSRQGGGEHRLVRWAPNGAVCLARVRRRQGGPDPLHRRAG